MSDTQTAPHHCLIVQVPVILVAGLVGLVFGWAASLLYAGALFGVSGDTRLTERVGAIVGAVSGAAVAEAWLIQMLRAARRRLSSPPATTVSILWPAMGYGVLAAWLSTLIVHLALFAINIGIGWAEFGARLLVGLGFGLVAGVVTGLVCGFVVRGVYGPFKIS